MTSEQLQKARELLEKVEGEENAARVLTSEAHKAGDHQTVWMGKATLAELGRLRQKLESDLDSLPLKSAELP